MKKDIKDLDLRDLESIAESFGEARYRAGQLFLWVHNRGVTSFDEMTDLSKIFRERLKKEYYISRYSIVGKDVSADGTSKFLLQLEDGNIIEAVVIPEEKRVTLCISTQAGCRMACSFCMTGRGGFIRNLKLSEMVGQVRAAMHEVSRDRRITNLVLMGMGEPLLNYDNVVKFLSIATDNRGLAIAPRRVTVSTAGIAPMIRNLGRDMPRVHLAVSLNAADDEVRDRLMPVNRRYRLRVLLDACKEYLINGGRCITIEYVLIAGVNDSLDDARRLSRLLGGIDCRINLIPFNTFSGSSMKRPERESIMRFQSTLMKDGYLTFLRESRGRDISAACGQLRGSLGNAPSKGARSGAAEIVNFINSP